MLRIIVTLVVAFLLVSGIVGVSAAYAHVWVIGDPPFWQRALGNAVDFAVFFGSIIAALLILLAALGSLASRPRG